MSREASASRPDQDGVPDVVRIPRASPLTIVADVVRHAIPLVPLYVFNGSLLGYMLLTTFDLAMGQVLIFNTTPGPVDPARGRGTILAAITWCWSASRRMRSRWHASEGRRRTHSRAQFMP
jgi:hypothetical protein